MVRFFVLFFLLFFNCLFFLQSPLWTLAVPQVLYKGDSHHQVWPEQTSEGVWHLLWCANFGRGILMQQPGCHPPPHSSHATPQLGTAGWAWQEKRTSVAGNTDRGSLDSYGPQLLYYSNLMKKILKCSRGTLWCRKKKLFFIQVLWREAFQLGDGWTLLEGRCYVLTGSVILSWLNLDITQNKCC